VDRCPIKEERCRAIDPALEGETHTVACIPMNEQRKVGD
jgi:hypothetical protein